jgi:hypothetical protein
MKYMEQQALCSSPVLKDAKQRHARVHVAPQQVQSSPVAAA